MFPSPILADSVNESNLHYVKWKQPQPGFLSLVTEPISLDDSLMLFILMCSILSNVTEIYKKKTKNKKNTQQKPTKIKQNKP